MHLHVLVLPSRVPGFQANALHPGKAAERAARASGVTRPAARAAAKSALGAFLDRYMRKSVHALLWRGGARRPRGRV